MDRREELFQKYKRLKQYKKLPDEKIWKKVDEKITEDEKVAGIDLTDLALDKKSLKVAQKLLKEYLKFKDFDEIAEKQDLKNVVWIETEIARLQDHIKKLRNDAENYRAEDEISQIINLQKEVTKLKEKLGFYKKDKEESDGFKIIQSMKERAKKWRAQNQNRHVWCPITKQMCWLKIRTDCYDPQKHPFFESRIVTNKKLLELFASSESLVKWFEKQQKEIKIVLRDGCFYLSDGEEEHKVPMVFEPEIMEIFEVGVEYVEWLAKQLRNHPKYQEVCKKILQLKEKDEEIDEEI